MSIMNVMVIAGYMIGLSNKLSCMITGPVLFCLMDNHKNAHEGSNMCIILIVILLNFQVKKELYTLL